MTFDLSSAPIVRLAWERGLGLPVDSLVRGAEGSRITHVQEGPEVCFLRLWDQAILIGPAAVLARMAEVGDDELSDQAVLLRLTRDLGGRGRGTHTLYYADDLPLQQPAGTITVSHGNPEAVLLESLCPPDDVNDVALGSKPHKFTLLGLPQDPGTGPGEEDDAPVGEPVACSGYAEYEGLLADLSTLVAPGYRRQGVGLLATSLAAHEALAAGLLVQWQSDVNNAGAHALALAAGFSVAGLRTRVLLQSPHK